ncbi:ATP-binding cassette domain-containing protein [Leptotrichia sp. oral taxon 212]|jgi:ABC transporter, ATP-binding protein|uniref:ATP-binding cassette domain-containing protein n=1 Tax=Leptotrichia sp. oral taxon 212 TaxID=712357 RepID=UPI0006A9BB5D|nr:ATP-binding cassette domain-containing protein [Leptotrichia sp. oral taxon 212]ALA94672.1 hypothetical protein AMK43_00160 [Leptotrichia sp. oral taxon 212]
MNIKITNLSKKYLKSKTKCLNDINVSINEGVYGLLGENGAGKTSLLKTIATILPIQTGNIQVDGKNYNDSIQEIRNIIGYLPQKFEFFNNLTVYETLDYILSLKKMKDNPQNRRKEIYEIIEKINLQEKINSKINNLSGGMKQRLAIAQALIGDSKLIILDEPTVGLDPGERLRFRNLINEYEKNRIIIISTHIISDISILCENIGVMKKGKLIYSGLITNLLEKIEGKIFIDEISDINDMNKKIYKNLISVTRKKNKLELRFFLEHFNKNEDKCLIEVSPTLEDAYFYLMNYNGDN